MPSYAERTKDYILRVILSSDLCHVRCACLAGQKIIIKKSLLVFERDRTGFLPGIFSRVWCCLALFLSLIFLFIITHLALLTIAPDGFIEANLKTQKQGIIYHVSVELIFSNKLTLYFINYLIKISHNLTLNLDYFAIIFFTVDYLILKALT